MRLFKITITSQSDSGKVRNIGVFSTIEQALRSYEIANNAPKSAIRNIKIEEV